MATFELSNAKLKINGTYINVMQINGDVDIGAYAYADELASWLFTTDTKTIGVYQALELFMVNWGRNHVGDATEISDHLGTNIYTYREFTAFDEHYSGYPYTSFRKENTVTLGMYYGLLTPTGSSIGRGYNYPLIYVYNNSKMYYCFLQSDKTSTEIGKIIRTQFIQYTLASSMLKLLVIRDDGYSGEGVALYTSSITYGFPCKLSTPYTPTPEPGPISANDDPYNGGGTSVPSGEGGGASSGGTFDAGLFKENVPVPINPTASAVDTSFISIFNPTLAELNNLANFMWSDAFSLETLKKLFENPMDFILGLSMLPVQIPDGGRGEVTVGNIVSTVYMTKAASQWVEVNCGSFEIPHYWNGYLDYSPYTKMQIYLPYVGYKIISIDEFVGRTIGVKYKVDILTGGCVAYITSNDSVLYQFSGQCAISIPVTGRDFTQMINSMVTLASSAVSVAAPLASVPTAGVVSAVSGMGRAAFGNVGATARALTSMKPDIQRSGNIGGSCGLLSVQTPYIIITRPSQCLPEYQNHFLGYPSYITAQLSTLTGFTIVEEIHIEGVQCTDDELAEIEELLKGGVLI